MKLNTQLSGPVAIGLVIVVMIFIVGIFVFRMNKIQNEAQFPAGVTPPSEAQIQKIVAQHPPLNPHFR